MKRRTLVTGVGASLLVSTLQHAGATQPWPQRAIRLVVPYAPGGTTDVASRLAADGASRTLGQQILVENRGGGSGVLGMEITIQSEPDGYTFVCAADSAVYQPHLRPSLKWSAEKDLVPVTLLVTQPIVVAVHPSLGVSSIQQLVTLAKAKPGELQYAVSGTGTTHHLAGALLAQRAGFSWTHVPYKGGGQAINDLVAGHVKIGMLGSGPVMPHVKSGRLKILAVTTKTRSDALPDIPTVAESGFPGYDVPQWFGVLAPAGTPADIVERMQTAMAGAITEPASKQQLQLLALDPVGSTSQAFADRIRTESAVWSKAAKELAIQPG